MHLKSKLKNQDVTAYKAEISRLENEVAALNEKVKAAEAKNEAVPETRKSKRKKKSKS
jgi:outer membrane murein-binding lipoprotein Lpp